MTRATITTTALNYGYISPRMRGRIDLSFFGQSCDYLLNYQVTPQGEVSYRNGFMYVARTRANKLARLVPFVYQTEKAYRIEMTDQYMRFYKDHGLITETPQNISNITRANPGVVTYVGSDTYANGDPIYLSDVSGMTEVNGMEYKVANVNTGANTFELHDIDGNPVDTTSFSAYTSGGTVAEIVQITTPYTEAELFELDYAQTENTMYIVHHSHQPMKLTRSSHTSWTLATYSFTSNPFGTTKATSQAITGITKANPGVVTYGGSDTYANGDTVYISGVVGMTDVNKKYFTVQNVNTTSNTFELKDFDTSSFSTYTSGGTIEKFTDFSWPSCVTLHEQRLVFAASDTYPTKIWFSRAGDLDSFVLGTLAADAIEYKIASDQSNRIRSVIGAESYLAILTTGSEHRANGGNENDGITPTSISIKPAGFNGSSSVRPLRLDSYILYVQRNGRTVRSYEYDALQAGYTSTDRTLLADHIGKSKFKQFSYTAGTPNTIWGVRNDGRMGGLTFDPTQKVVAWHQHNTQGEFISVATAPEIDGDDELWVVVKRSVNGINQYYVEYSPSDGDIPIFEDYFTGESNFETDQNTYLSALWNVQKMLLRLDSALVYDGRDLATVNLTVTGGTDTDDVVTVTASGPYFNSGFVGKRIQTPEGGQIEITAYTDTTHVTGVVLYELETASLLAGEWALMASVLSGINHLEGETVGILADGGTEIEQVVDGGVITLDEPAGYIIVGLTYNGIGKTQSLEGGGEKGAVQVKLKNVEKVGVKMRASAGTKFGTSLYNLEHPAYRNFDEKPGRPPRLTDQVINVPISDSWDENKALYWLHDKPTPSNIQLISVDIEATSD